MTNMITALNHLAIALQEAFDDEDRIPDAKEAMDEVNRLLHSVTDIEMGALAANMIELAISMLD